MRYRFELQAPFTPAENHTWHAVRLLEELLTLEGGLSRMRSGEQVPIVVWKEEKIKPCLAELKSRPKKGMNRESWLAVLKNPRVLIPATRFFVEGRGLKSHEAFTMRHPELNPMMLAGVSLDQRISGVVLVGVGEKIQTGPFLPYIMPADADGRWLRGEPLDALLVLQRRRPDNDLACYEQMPGRDVEGNVILGWQLSQSDPMPTPSATKRGTTRRVTDETRRLNLVAESARQYEQWANPVPGHRTVARIVDAISRGLQIQVRDMNRLARALKCLLTEGNTLEARLSAFARTLQLHSRAGRRKDDRRAMMQQALATLEQVKLIVAGESRADALVKVAKRLSSEENYDGRLRTLQRWNAKHNFSGKENFDVSLL